MFDLTKYLSNGALWFVLMSIYNYWMENKGFFSSVSLTDWLTFSLSNIVGDITAEVIWNVILPYNSGMVKNYVIEPIFTGIIYMYVYEMFVAGKLQYGRRTQQNNFMLGAGVNILESWIENPLLKMFGFSVI